VFGSTAPSRGRAFSEQSADDAERALQAKLTELEGVLEGKAVAVVEASISKEESLLSGLPPSLCPLCGATRAVRLACGHELCGNCTKGILCPLCATRLETAGEVAPPHFEEEPKET
jgi:hypothetical protein